MILLSPAFEGNNEIRLKTVYRNLHIGAPELAQTAKILLSALDAMFN
jgi:hypothetical protein